MVMPMRTTGGSGAFDAAEAVGWGWTGPKSADRTPKIWLKRLAFAGLGAMTASF
jgi:hypothetical protein